MRLPLTLTALSALALVGSGAGVLLGRSAVAEINPVYFSEAATRFHSDLSATPPSMDAPPALTASELSAAELGQALGTGCVRCRTASDLYYPVHDTDEDGYRTGWALVDSAPVAQQTVQDSEPAVEADAERARADAEHAAALARVHAYSSYAVAADSRLEVAAAPADPAQLASAEPVTE